MMFFVRADIHTRLLPRGGDEVTGARAAGNKDVERASCLSPGHTTALELGCGAGRISREVAPLVDRLQVVDVSRAMVVEARQYLAHCQNVTVTATNGYALPGFPDNAFDVVFGPGFLANSSRTLGPLDEVHRVLAKAGFCVFNFLTIDHPDDARALRATVRDQARRRQFHGGTDRGYAGSQSRAVYEAIGLQVVEPEAGGIGTIAQGRGVLVGQA
jgi:ubiquinone/menaquinone biosynthesis C-methylase UbiE